MVHGGATRVTDWRREGGPELLTAVASGLESADRTRLASQIAESRAAVAQLIVAGAAGTDGLDAESVTSAEEGDAVAAYRNLWRDIATASGNLAAQLTLNSLDAGLDALEGEGLAVFEAEAARTDEITSLVSAIAGGDVTGAQKAAAGLLGGAAVQV